MGRPLNSKFFGNDTGRLLVTEAWMNGSAAAEACSIVRQRSNLIYEVQAEVAESSATLTIGSRYLIVALGSADFTTVGAASNTVGTVFTATGTNAGAGGTAAERDFCKLQAAAPTAPGECRIEITPENATATVQATVTTTTVGGAGTALDTVVIANAGYGYWADATGVALAAGDGTIDYTVDGNGSLATVTINSAGTTNTAGTLAIATAPATNPPVQYARIINAHHVKTFEGSTFAWPTTAPLGGFRGIFGEADIDVQ